jgi:hypothetical protein
MPNPIDPKMERLFFDALDRKFTDAFPTYEQFILYLDWAGKLHSADLDDLAATGNLVYSRYIWHRAGRPTYELRPTIFQALCETELPEDFLVDEIRTPYEGMCIQLPRGSLTELGEFHPERIYLTSVPSESLFRVIGDSRAEDQVIHTKLAIRPGLTIEEAIAYTIHNCSWTQQKKDPKALRAFYQESPTFRFAVNLILYLVCPEVDIVEDKRRLHELHSKLQGMPRSRRRETLEEQLRKTKENGKTYIIGASFRPAPLEEISNLTESGKKWMLQRRIRVPGFWRWQPHGPKSSLRRRQFIQPHWRGPTFAELVERGFVVR